MNQEKRVIEYKKLTSEQRDALIAEHVMLLRVHRISAEYIPEVAVILDENDVIVGNPDPYSTDMNAALRVVKCDKFYAYLLEGSQDISYGEPGEFERCSLYMNTPQGPKNVYACAKTLPDAICIAALRGIGFKVIT